MIRVLFFARIREAMGCSEQSMELPEGVVTIGQLRDALVDRGAPWSDALGPEQALLYAVNEEVAEEGYRIQDEDDIAFFPPVTGG